MSKQATLPVTAEDAIARILNVDYLHEGTTLQEMLEAYSDDAENDCKDERAKREAIHVPHDEARLSDGEARDFDYENDDAQRWINQEEHKRYQ